jgi:hypothetical protein
VSFQYCTPGKSKSILFDKNTRAEGQVIRDSIFDGLVKFYDVKSNRLVKEENYKNGVLDGPCSEFYQNGILSIKYEYSNGLVHGHQYLYDTVGRLISENNYYYGLRVGDGIEYGGNGISDYNFYSLDNTLLFHISYDSVKQKKILDLEKNFFFYTQSEYQIMDSMHLSKMRKEYLLYLPNPPKFRFDYTLVVVDSMSRVKSEVAKFSTKYPWVRFDRPEINYDKNNALALQIVVADSNKVVGKAHLIKHLN